MPENEMLEEMKLQYAVSIPAAVRKAALECVESLAWDAGPSIGERWAANQGDEVAMMKVQAFDAAIEEFTDHLKKTLLLDPKPYGVSMDGIKIHARFEVDERLPGDEFAPRVGYSQNEEDYRA